MGIRMLGGGVQGSQCDGKNLTEILAAGGGDKWGGKQRRRWTCIGCPVRSVSTHHANRERLNGGIEHAETRADTGLARTTQDFIEQTVSGSVRRIGKADARSKIEIPWEPQSARNSRIGWVKNSSRSAGKNDGLLARLKCRDLVVFLIPGLNAVPAQAVIER